MSREIDKQIAEMMGWKPCERSGFWERDGVTVASHFHPSTDIKDAWIVVEWANNHITIEYDLDMRNWSVAFWSEKHCKWVRAEAKSTPMAICLSALKVKEAWDENL